MENWIKSVENAIGTAARWFLGVFRKARKDAPEIKQIADRVFPWAKMVVDGVLVAEGGGAIAPEANAIMDEIGKDLDVACAAIYDVGVTPTASSFVQSIAANLEGLITGSHVKNPANVALIRNVIGSLLALIGITQPPKAA